MNIVFIGGGSFRTLPIVRAAMAHQELFHQGKIRIVDFNLARAETVGKLIMKSPEYADSNCKVEWTDQLDNALPGADVVSVSFPVGSAKVCKLSEQACLEHGFFGSDQISLSGAFRSITGGSILWDIAKRMEKYCPDAWLIDFANPVAVYSGIINNHTKIKALGICGGFANHRWDLPRLLFGRDEYCDNFEVSVAGVNHCSFLLKGTYQGKDLYKLIDDKIFTRNWKPCRISSCPEAEKSIRHGLTKLAEMRRRFGTIIFSTEGDGMMHIFFEEMLQEMLKNYKPWSNAEIDKWVAASKKEREKTDIEFSSSLNKELNQEFWNKDMLENPHFAANPADVTVPILKALGGISREWIVASAPNRGAVRGFKDRTVLEYSMTLDKDGIHPDPNLEIPDCFHGLISTLATHQTLLGDAIANKDPKLLADALFAYPIYQNTQAAKNLWRELLKIHAEEMPQEFQNARDYF